MIIRESIEALIKCALKINSHELYSVNNEDLCIKEYFVLFKNWNNNQQREKNKRKREIEKNVNLFKTFCFARTYKVIVLFVFVLLFFEWKKLKIYLK